MMRKLAVAALISFAAMPSLPARADFVLPETLAKIRVGAPSPSVLTAGARAYKVSFAISYPPEGVTQQFYLYTTALVTVFPETNLANKPGAHGVPDTSRPGGLQRCTPPSPSSANCLMSVPDIKSGTVTLTLDGDPVRYIDRPVWWQIVVVVRDNSLNDVSQVQYIRVLPPMRVRPGAAPAAAGLSPVTNESRAVAMPSASPVPAVTAHSQPARPAPGIATLAILATPPPIPPEQIAFYNKLKAHTAPAMLAKLQSAEPAIDARLKSSPNGDPRQIATAGVMAVFGSLPAADVDQLVFIVLMDATNAQDRDLAQLASDMQKQTAAKQQLRSQGETSTTGPVSAPRATSAPAGSTSDMSGVQSQRLQLAMDRRSQFVETLSNLMKKISDTNGSVINNLK